jgi:hypothetical protein
MTVEKRLAIARAAQNEESHLRWRLELVSRAYALRKARAFPIVWVDAWQVYIAPDGSADPWGVKVAIGWADLEALVQRAERRPVASECRKEAAEGDGGAWSGGYAPLVQAAKRRLA